MSETWPFGWLKSEHKKPCLFHFPSLTASFKILHWDSQAVKTGKRGWSAKSVVEKHKEERSKKEGEEGHIRELRKKQNLQVKEIFKDLQKPQLPQFDISCGFTHCTKVRMVWVFIIAQILRTHWLRNYLVNIWRQFIQSTFEWNNHHS